MDLKEIGKFIATLRKESNLTQEKLGEMIGVSNKTLSRYETGVYMPPADILLKMSEIFNVSINEILAAKKLDDKSFKEVADKNLTEVLKHSSFNLQDRISFFRKKWYKEHVFEVVFSLLLSIGVFVLGVIFKKFWISFLGMLIFIILYAFINNRMRTFVENNAFDGKGID